MNKTNYLKDLREALQSHGVLEVDIKDVISDYEGMYEDALERGLSDDEAYNLLGDPNQVYEELRDTLQMKQMKRYKHKFIALSPFLAVLVFMTVGMSTDIWHPTWLIFLIIPITAIILSTQKEEKIVALSPFVAVITFILVGTYTNYWNPAWLVFLIIPLVALVYEKNNVKKALMISSILIAAAFYLYMGYAQDDFRTGLFGFILPLVVMLYYAELQFELVVKNPLKRKNAIVFASVIFGSIATFFLLGYLADGWAYAWMVFLLIPMTAIYLYDQPRKLTPFMPFIAVIIFYSLGFFFGLFAISWIAFLLIPVVAIIENA
jgi:uncharacterized membrane protein